jgi:hypothetical protein
MLMSMPWLDPVKNDKEIGDMWYFYCSSWRTSAQMLTDMEREGVFVDVAHLEKAEAMARGDIDAAEQAFRRWASQYIGKTFFFYVFYFCLFLSVVVSRLRLPSHWCRGGR